MALKLTLLMSHAMIQTIQLMQKPVLILKLNLLKLKLSLFQMKLMLLKLSHPQALMSFQSQPSQSAVLERWR